VPIEQVAGTELTWYLIAFDKSGRERTTDPDGGVLSERLLEELRAGGTTDIFLMSHGWKSDLPAAREQNNEWISAMIGCRDDLASARSRCPGFRPVIAGLHWPSLPFGDEEFGAADGTRVGLERMPRTEDLIDTYADRIADSGPARAALRTIFESAVRKSDPAVLPSEVAEAYRTLNREAGLDAAGPGAAPGGDREPFDPESSYQNARGAGASSPATFAEPGMSGVLGPLWQLSFWQMKRRANRFGEAGGRNLLERIRETAPAARLHLMGHSFGCIVMAAMLAGPRGRAPLPRPVETLFLAQGALSLWSFCSRIELAEGVPGYFRSVISDSQVGGALIATTSRFDCALGKFYPLAAGVAHQIGFAVGELPRYGAVGVYGIQGPDTAAESMHMKPASERYGFHHGGIYNLSGDDYIRQGSGAAGAHSDIAHAEVAHAYWEGILVSM
jgi:hypothetical protein